MGEQPTLMRPSGKYFSQNLLKSWRNPTTHRTGCRCSRRVAECWWIQSFEKGAEKKSVQDNSPTGTLTGADDADGATTKADLASDLVEIEVQKGTQKAGHSWHRKKRLVA